VSNEVTQTIIEALVTQPDRCPRCGHRVRYITAYRLYLGVELQARIDPDRRVAEIHKHEQRHDELRLTGNFAYCEKCGYILVLTGNMESERELPHYEMSHVFSLVSEHLSPNGGEPGHA